MVRTAPSTVNPEKSEQARWFAEEVQPHESSLRSWLRGLFPSLSDTDDLVQESYIRLFRAKQGGKVNCAKAYLFATARNVAMDIFRHRKVVSIESVADLAKLNVVEDRPSLAEAVSQRQELEFLVEAVRDLPERCRQTITLRMVYGLSVKEIAAELKISPHTVKAQLAKGMSRCASYFEDRGIRRG